MGQTGERAQLDCGHGSLNLGPGFSSQHGYQHILSPMYVHTEIYIDSSISIYAFAYKLPLESHVIVRLAVRFQAS